MKLFFLGGEIPQPNPGGDDEPASRGNPKREMLHIPKSMLNMGYFPIQDSRCCTFF